MNRYQVVRQAVNAHVREYVVAHPGVSYDVCVTESLREAPALTKMLAGEVLNKKARAYVEDNPGVDYQTALEKMMAENKGVAELYVYAESDLQRQARNPHDGSPLISRSDAGKEIDAKVRALLAAKPELKGDYNAAMKQVLHSDPALRQRYMGTGTDLRLDFNVGDRTDPLLDMNIAGGTLNSLTEIFLQENPNFPGGFLAAFQKILDENPVLASAYIGEKFQPKGVRNI